MPVYFPLVCSFQGLLHVRSTVASLQLRKAGLLDHVDEQYSTSDKLGNVWKGEIDPVNHERREKVKDAMRHAWNSYVSYAWGQDELKVYY